MRRRTTLAFVAGGALAVAAVAAVASGILMIPIEKLSRRLRGSAPEACASPGADSQFTLYAPGGRWGFMPEEAHMKKAWVIAAVVAGGALLARALGSGVGKTDIGERIAAMPDTSPPKWIYTNVTAIRANTDRILALLEEQRPTAAGEPVPPPEPEAAREA
jgi:hypothetical protein